MASVVAVCRGAGRRKFTYFLTAAVRCPNPGTRAGKVSCPLLRGSSAAALALIRSVQSPLLGKRRRFPGNGSFSWVGICNGPGLVF